MKSILLVFFTGLLLAYAPESLAVTPDEWIQQFGTPAHDEGARVSADGLGNVYISGGTHGSLTGTNAGDSDAYIRKYNASGGLLWSRQLGTSGFDYAMGTSADGLGNVYTAGWTWGPLGGTYSGLSDVFIAKYNSAGTQLWIRQLGTSTVDEARSVSADKLGNVFVGGTSSGNLSGGINSGAQDAFVSKYNSSGSLLWTRLFGTSTEDTTFSISADGLGNVYAAGYTAGSLDGSNMGSYDVFVRKYDAAGSLLWAKQVGTSSYDDGHGVAFDGSGNVYVAGWTSGSLGGPNAGGYDAFLRKYDAAGNLSWTRQLGTTDDDEYFSVAADPSGNVYITGLTFGSLGNPQIGGGDVYVSKYSSAGVLIGTRQLGTPDLDLGFDVSSDGSGSVYLSGSTYGNFGGPNGGNSNPDAYLVKLSALSIPEPCTIAFAPICLLGLLRRQRYQSSAKSFAWVRVH
jgi:hypothetical protein